MTASPITTPFHLDGNYRPVTTELTESELPVEGTIPEALNGRYLRNGPNPRPGAPSTHWFYGDGMIHGVELSAGHARWYRNRWVRTNTFTDGATLLRSDWQRRPQLPVSRTRTSSRTPDAHSRSSKPPSPTSSPTNSTLSARTTSTAGSPPP